MLRKLLVSALAVALAFAASPAGAATYYDSGTIVPGFVPIDPAAPLGGGTGPLGGAANPLNVGGNVNIGNPLGPATTPANSVAGVAPDGLTGTGSATGVVANVFGSPISTAGFNSVQFAITGTFSATLAVYGSTDGTHWSPALWTQTVDTGFCSTNNLSTVSDEILFSPYPFLEVAVTAYVSGSVNVAYSLRSNTASSPFVCGNNANPIPALPVGNAGGSYALLHAQAASLVSSLAVKSTGFGNLYNFSCSGITGGAAGHCVAINAVSAPTPGSAIVPIDSCDFSATQTDCKFTHNGFSTHYGTGITILITTNASPYVYTNGTDTGFIEADYF